MSESRLVALLIGGLVGVPWLLAVAPWELTFGGGVALLALGLLVGVPAGALYHVRLWRALHPARLWWLHPTALHAELREPQRHRVLRSFRVGAVGFVMAIAGCALAAAGALRG